MPPWQAGADHLTLHVRLTPKAATDRIDGVSILSDGREVLTVRVRAAPESGKANAALVKIIAAALGAPRSSVRVARGGQSRLKQLRVDGAAASLMDMAASLWPSLRSDEEEPQ